MESEMQMTNFEERKTHLKLSSSTKSRTISAPWFLSGHGDPIQLKVPPNAKACFDKRSKVLHVRDSKRGLAKTVTPSVYVSLDYSQDFHEIEFVDLEDPANSLAGIYISEGVLSFEDQKMFEFSNTEMFASLCRILASPEFNPWNRLPELKNEYSHYQCDLSAGTIRVNPEIEGVHSVDEARSPLLSFRFETNSPIECWNKDTRKDDRLPPGTYSAEVIESDHNTGDVQTLKVDGWDTEHKSYCTFHVPFQPLNWMIENDEAAYADARYRIPFDPRVHTDLAIKSVAEPNPSGFFSRLLGR